MSIFSFILMTKLFPHGSSSIRPFLGRRIGPAGGKRRRSDR